MSDLYEILGVNPNASLLEITTSYRNLAKIYHPDKPTGNLDKFKELSHAYTILSDPQKRHIYDVQGIEGVQVNDRAKSRHQQGGDFQEQTYHVPINNEIFNNIFDHFFNKTDTKADMDTVLPMTIIVTISLKESYSGCVKPLKYQRDLLCPTCYGKGTKQHNNDKCGRCAGHRVVSTENEVDVVVKPGMNDQYKIKFENLGHEEYNKSTGDLIVQLSVRNDTQFKTNGSHLELTQNITLAEALNGVSRELIFIDGNKFLLGTHPNQTVLTNQPTAYKGCGLPIYSEFGTCTYGDLYVSYNIILPNKIPKNTRKIITDCIDPCYKN
jgi:DnaJ-class molecular chaperone